MPGIRNKSHNEMMNILNQFCMQQLGFAPVGEIRMLTTGSDSSTITAHAYFRDRINEANIQASIYDAYSATVGYRNDVILVTPDSHAWKGDTNSGGEALTWSKQNTHMLGMGPGEVGGYQRCRFGHTGYTMANFMTVSGASNKFKNLRFMHGSATGGASDTTCLTVTGAGNIFEWVNFAGPMDATQSASANYVGVYINGGSSNYFRKCLFGTQNAIQRSGANCMLKIAGAGGLNVFEDCIFRSNSLTSTTPYFINWGGTECLTPQAIFLNCQFINSKAAASSAMTVAIVDSSHANNTLFFDNRCTFTNCTDIVAAASETKILWGSAGATADYAAVNDRANVGLAQNPNHTT